MPVAAIFDLDGTLVTFEFDIREWRRVLIGLMRERGFSTEGVDDGTPTQQVLDFARGQVAVDPGRFERLRSEAFLTLDSLELRGVASSSVFPGTAEVLKSLRSKGVRLCVLTNSGRAAAYQSLRKSGLLEFFEFVLTRDDTETMKPRPEGVLKAVAMLGVTPGQACYVGDSRYDIMAAKQAGAVSVGVATGTYDAERLRKEGADFVIERLADLPAVLGV